MATPRPRSTRLLVVVLVSLSLAVITLDYRQGEAGPLEGVPLGIKDLFVVDFFNTSLLSGLGLGQMLRLYGPNISPVSFAYGIGFFSLFLFAIGRAGLGALAFVLMLLCGVKGAAIMGVAILISTFGCANGMVLACNWHSWPLSKPLEIGFQPV